MIFLIRAFQFEYIKESGHVYRMKFDVRSVNAAMHQIRAWAADPELDFNSHDAGRLSKMVQHNLSKVNFK